ncbi:hypothetical protein [Melittangium boletus]|uniref:hypothetical protein n=1 Tax=Melittangium boletus TaxID=83453 RepID=UPI003DA6B168
MRPAGGTWLAGALLLACPPGLQAQTFDSVTAACRTRPAGCAGGVGDAALVSHGTRLAEAGVRLGTIAAVLETTERARIERALTECADQARSEVLERHLEGRSPTAAECQEKGLFGGRHRTRAMYLGEEMHRVALACAAAALGVLRPGGFSVEPRYRYESRTKQWEFMSAETETMLLEEGCHGELRGTIKPDIVIHSGAPLMAQAVYDFKFPCVRLDRGDWCMYSSGPYQGRTQREIYLEVLGVPPSRVLSRVGVMP